MKVDFVEKEGSYSLGSDGFLSGAENYPLSKAMVDHDQQRVKVRRGGEVGDKVTRDLLEGARHAVESQYSLCSYHPYSRSSGGLAHRRIHASVIFRVL